MKPRLLAFALLVIALLVVGLLPAAAQTTAPQPPAAPSAPARLRPQPDYRPPVSEPNRGPRDDAPQPTPEEAGDPRLAARRAQRQAERQARQPVTHAPQTFSAGPQLPITAGPERIPAAVLPDDSVDSYSPSVSADGRYIAFQSEAGNLVAGDLDGGQPDIFVYDHNSGETELVSVPPGGGQIYGFFYEPSISDDGRYVAFYGWTNDLIPTEELSNSDIYVVDRDDGSVIRVSDAYDGSESDGHAFSPVLSPDGGYVAFRSDASNLVPDDNNGANDIFLHDIAAGTTVRVSVSSDEVETSSSSYVGGVSEYGLFVSFYSYADNLVANDSNYASDVFVRDVVLGTTERVSVVDGVPGEQANWFSYTNDISTDGRYVVFESDADNLVAGDDNGLLDIFVRDRIDNVTHRVSLTENGAKTDNDSYEPIVADDGHTVAFTTYSALVADDTNNDEDVYVRNWFTGVVVRASVDSGGGDPNSYSKEPALSADATSVAFGSDASDLVTGDNNAAYDIFLRMLSGAAPTLVSGDAFPLTEPAGDSYDPAVSADGRYVAFSSIAGNLVPGNAGGYWHIYLYDRHLDETTRISLSVSNEYARGDSDVPDISDDGNRIAFASWAWDLVADDNNDETDIFVYDRAAGTTVRVSVDSDGNESNGWSYSPVISGNGNVVAFQSYADNLVAGDTNGVSDIFVRDLTSGETTRVSVSSAGAEGNNEAYSPALSWDGRYVVFESWAENLVDLDTNSYRNVFVHDRVLAETTLVSVDIWGEAAHGGAWAPTVSADGRYVAFTSPSDELVPGDTNWINDIFVRDLWSGTTSIVSHALNGGMTDNHSDHPDISAEGRFIAFDSRASNLVTDDTNEIRDTFLYDRLKGETARLSVSSGGEQGDKSSEQATISADGTTTVFSSEASTLVTDDNYALWNIFVGEQDTSEPTLHSVSGTVYHWEDYPLEGVALSSLSVPGTTVITDSDGEYTLWLPAGSHTIVATLENYQFLPTQQIVTLGPNRTGIDFTGYYAGWMTSWYPASDDAYVDQAKKTSNFGSASFLRVKNAAADMNTYLKFTVDTLDPEPGTCRTYSSSFLRTWVKEPSLDGGSVYAVSNSWAENTIIWNNAPTIGGVALGKIDATVDESDVITHLGRIVTGNGIYSLAIRNNSSNSADFRSWESGWGPEIGITFRQEVIQAPTAELGVSHGWGIAPFTVAFTNYSEGCPTSWHWDFGDGTTSTERDPIHTFNAIGDYDVTLTVTNGYGSDSTTETLHAVGLPTRYYVSPAANATIGGMPVQGADILLYDKPTNHWTMVYDGSAHGTLKNITAFAFEGNSLLLVFAANQAIAGLGTATPYDIVRFTPDAPDVYPLGSGTFSWAWRGKPNGLSTLGEKVDAIAIGWGDYYFSITGAGSLPTTPPLKPADEDLIVWPTWANAWNHIGLDGSTVAGLAVEDINGVSYDLDTGDIYITMPGSFNLGGVAGTGKSIVRLNPNGGSLWDSSTHWTPSLVQWLAPGATISTTIDAIELQR